MGPGWKISYVTDNCGDVIIIGREDACSSFFVSSRRRHTRSDRDWSSDVCSSDLYHGGREIVTNSPPSSGGVLIAHMLAVLRGVPGPLPPGRARTLRAYAEAMRA